jgi:hypothetical protein
METTMHRVFRSAGGCRRSRALGVAILVAAWAGGDPAFGAFGLGLMTALGAVFLLGGRSETLSGLGRPGRDEHGRDRSHLRGCRRDPSLAQLS